MTSEQKEITHKDIKGLDLPFDYQNMDTLTLKQGKMFEEALVKKLTGFDEGYHGMAEYIKSENKHYKKDNELNYIVELFMSKKNEPLKPKEWGKVGNCFMNNPFWQKENHKIIMEAFMDSTQMDVIDQNRKDHAVQYLKSNWSKYSDQELPEWLTYKNPIDGVDDIDFVENALQYNLNNPWWDYVYKNLISVYAQEVLAKIEILMEKIEDNYKFFSNLDDSEDDCDESNYEGSDHDDTDEENEEYCDQEETSDQED